MRWVSAALLLVSCSCTTTEPAIKQPCVRIIETEGAIHDPPYGDTKFRTRVTVVEKGDCTGVAPLPRGDTDIRGRLPRTERDRSIGSPNPAPTYNGASAL